MSTDLTSCGKTISMSSYKLITNFSTKLLCMHNDGLEFVEEELRFYAYF